MLQFYFSFQSLEQFCPPSPDKSTLVCEQICMGINLLGSYAPCYTVLPNLCFILSTLRRWDKSAAVQELFSFLGIGAKQTRHYNCRKFKYATFSSQVFRLECCIFWPAFWYFAQSKAGQNTLFTPIRNILNETKSLTNNWIHDHDLNTIIVF